MHKFHDSFGFDERTYTAESSKSAFEFFLVFSEGSLVLRFDTLAKNDLGEELFLNLDVLLPHPLDLLGVEEPPKMSHLILFDHVTEHEVNWR